jgi:hypothetical protein
LKVPKLLSMVAAIGAVATSHPASPSAGSHLPSLEITPNLKFSRSDDVTPASGIPFVDDLKLSFSAHFSASAAAVATANAAGYPHDKRPEFGITQAVTVVVPADPKHGVSDTATNA